MNMAFLKRVSAAADDLRAAELDGGGESYGEFFEPGFLHNFAKNDRQDLNMGCIDASRRQLQSVLKVRV
jgi:hypothetical protein